LTTDNLAEVSAQQCPRCSGVIADTDRFCGHCGKEILAVLEGRPLEHDVLKTLTPTLVYYFVTLVLLATYKLTDVFPQGFEGMAIISGIDIFFVIIFSAFYFRELKPLFSLKGLSMSVLSLTIAGATIAAILVTGLASIIQVSIQDDVFYSTYLFEDTSNPFLWAVLFICVQPAIFEEVTFRGFLYTNLQTVTSARSAIYITAFIFGIIHLAVISMLWLVPLGLIFAFMRMKYHTLWYGVVGHFVYNFVITLIDFWGGLN
jgi:membrane protease YdiL (CAAX protease family)